MIVRTMLLIVLVVLLAGGAWQTRRAPRVPMPAPTERGEVGEGDGFAARRAQWIESQHVHAPGVDWRAQDAATRAAKEQRRLHGPAPAAITAAPAGTWIERGARNQAGRVSDVDYDVATDRLTVFAHGGQLWRSLRASLNWQPLNDPRHFEPGGNMQHFRRLSGSPERLIAADDTRHDLFWSDDQGATWNAGGGYQPANWYETTYLAVRDVAGAQVYALVGDYNFAASAWQARLLASNDRGATYADLGFLGTKEKVALFAPGQGSNLVYVQIGATLKRIETNNTLTTLGTIATPPAQGGGDQVGLAGGIATGNAPFLFAFMESGGSTQVFRSTDAGTTWFPRGTVPAYGSLRVAAGSARKDPNLAFYGGVNLWRSIDGGQNFAVVNDWSDYYGSESNKLHADISFVSVFADSGGNDVFFVGTDGGLFQSTDGLATVSNLSLTKLRQAQYYDSYTGRNPPYSISIGTQDQGYQRAARASSGIANYKQVISGDYSHLTSSDGGNTIWMTYPGFAQLDPTPAGSNEVTPAWQYTDASLQNWLFLAPIMADPANSHVAWLAGGASTAGVNHVFKLTWNGTIAYDNTIGFSEGTFDFGNQVTALSYSPQNPATRFVVAKAPSGNNARFFRTTTPDTAWTLGAANLPQGQFFYGTTIAPDPVRANTIYVGGSGYSGPGVYVSTNNGDTFVAMNTGLPSTLVYSLIISPDGNHLFAATEVGPYYYDRAGNTWVDIGAGAPESIYWNVDYIPALKTARFSTYGRGLWDFELGGGDLIFRDGLE